MSDSTHAGAAGPGAAFFLTAKAVAELHQVTDGTIRRWIRSGHLSAVKWHRQYYIPASAVHSHYRLVAAPTGRLAIDQKEGEK